MIEVSRCSSAAPDVVWDVLADGWGLAGWVVGAARVDGVDRTWPAVGSAMRYRVGAWPALVPARAEVRTCVPGRELALHGDLGPAGAVDLHLSLRDLRPGCEIVMREDLTGGPGRRLPRALRSALIAPRNVETLHRLALLGERPA